MTKRTYILLVTLLLTAVVVFSALNTGSTGPPGKAQTEKAVVNPSLEGLSYAIQVTAIIPAARDVGQVKIYDSKQLHVLCHGPNQEAVPTSAEFTLDRGQVVNAHYREIDYRWQNMLNERKIKPPSKQEIQERYILPMRRS